jgi:uncharacterized protein YbjT (DUF2867 family)
MLPLKQNKSLMKKVLIIGATGSLARYVIEALQQMEGVSLTLFMRNKSKLTKNLAEGCTLIEGDAMKYADVNLAVATQDIVYINLAGNLDAMANNIVKAMRENKVQRVIAISSIGIYQEPVKSILAPYRKLANVIENSGLDYTILRPDWFTHANEVDYALTRKGTPETGSAVSRKSIAAFIATMIANPELHKNENLGISKPN